MLSLPGPHRRTHRRAGAVPRGGISCSIQKGLQLGSHLPLFLLSRLPSPMLVLGLSQADLLYSSSPSPLPFSPPPSPLPSSLSPSLLPASSGCFPSSVFLLNISLLAEAAEGGGWGSELRQSPWCWQPGPNLSG